MHLSIRLALPVLILAAVRGQAERDPGAVLERARANLQEMTRRLAKYACIETVERSYYEPPPRPMPAASCSQVQAARAARTAPPKLEAADRLRLEVTVSEGHEIHAWPGATRFDTRDVDEIIHQGPIGTGAFGMHLIGVFDNPAVDYQYVGEKPDGQPYRARIQLPRFPGSQPLPRQDRRQVADRTVRRDVLAGCRIPGPAALHRGGRTARRPPLPCASWNPRWIISACASAMAICCCRARADSPS